MELTQGWSMSTKFIELVDILTGLIGDLTISVEVLKDYESKDDFNSPENHIRKQCVWRLCFSSIVLNCRKYVEACERYGKELNDAAPELSAIKGKYIKKINDNTAFSKLRKNYVAHVQIDSDPNKRTLSQAEVQELFIEVIGDSKNAVGFLNWICPSDIENSKLEDSLVGTIQLLRDQVSSKL